MIQTSDARARSIVLRSDPILLVDIVVATPHAWKPSLPGIKTRSVDLTLGIAEVLRGNSDFPRTLDVTVEQSDYADVLQMRPLPGAWSGLDLSPGSKWVLFCHGKQQFLAPLLADCALVAPAALVAPGVRIAQKAINGQLSLSETLALATPLAAELDPLFVEFLYAAYGASAMSFAPDFSLLMALSESPQLRQETRQALLTGAYDLVTDTDAVPSGHRRHLALTMFRTLLMPQASALHANLASPYLPNLLGITSAQPKLTAASVFEHNAPLLAAVKAALQGPLKATEQTALAAWLGK